MTSSSRTLVSVVIPVYNHAGYVGQCLDSVLQQTHRPIQLIIIDDGSRDGSPARIEEHLRRRGDVPGVEIIFRARENRGAHHTLNEGLAAATGEFVALLNSDDYYHPERLERCLHACLAAKADFAFTHIEVVGKDGDVLPADHSWCPWYNQACVEEQKEAAAIGFALLRSNLAVSTGNFFFRRSLYAEIGPFQDYVIAHDMDFLLRTLVVTEPLLIREKLYFYRLHGANTVYAQIQRMEDEFARIYAAYLVSVAERPPRNPLAPSPWHWPARFQRAIAAPRLAGALDRLLVRPASSASSGPPRAEAGPPTSGTADLEAIGILLPDLSVTEASRHALALAELLRGRGHPVRVVSVEDGPLRSRLEELGITVQLLRADSFGKLARRAAGYALRLPPDSPRTVWFERLARALRGLSDIRGRIPLRFDLPYRLRLLQTGFGLPRRVLAHSFAAWPLVAGLRRTRSFARLVWFVSEPLAPEVMLANTAAGGALAGIAREATTRMVLTSEASRRAWAAAGAEAVTRHWSGRSRTTPAPARRIAGTPVRSLLSVADSRDGATERTLVEAFALARRLGRIPEEARLTIAGLRAPSVEAGTADLILRTKQPDLNGRVILVGPVEDEALDPLVAAADLYIHVSARELPPRALIAAMAMQVPILSASSAAGQDVIVHGQTGWLVSPAGIQPLADALAEVMAHPEPAEAMVRAARAAFEERCCRERTEDELLQAVLD